MDIKDLPVEKRFRRMLNGMAEETSRTHKCAVCGSALGVDIYEDVDEEMESLMPEHSAIGNCRNCRAVALYTFVNLFPEDEDSKEDVKVEYRILTA